MSCHAQMIFIWFENNNGKCSTPKKKIQHNIPTMPLNELYQIFYNSKTFEFTSQFKTSKFRVYLKSERNFSDFFLQDYLRKIK